MRKDIAGVIIGQLKEHGEQTTAELQRAVQNSGLKNSQHRYGPLSKFYLGPLESEGAIRLVGRKTGEGGDIWAISGK